MSWLHLQLDILEDLAGQHWRAERRGATEEGGLEALRVAWRERQAVRGECRACRRPKSAESKTWCDVHLEKSRASARASYEKGRAA